MLEIQNMEMAMEFVTENVDQLTKIDHAFIRELHKMVVQNLTREGDRTPGSYRNFDVTINNSSHKPPTHVKVSEYMDELIGFINTPVEKQYELITGAIAHHRFTWVHPFGNGNGRVVRLLTYSMLVKQGFRVSRGRILNPSAIFCIDREKYYSMLAKADTGTDSGILEWVEYVLVGMLAEINKIDNLLDREYLTNKILKPAIELCLRVKSITSLQASILNMAATKMSISAVDLHSIMPDKLPAARSREIKRLKEQEMLMPVTAEGLPAENARFYVIDFANSYLLRGVIRALRDEKFLGVQELEKRSI